MNSILIKILNTIETKKKARLNTASYQTNFLFKQAFMFRGNSGQKTYETISIGTFCEFANVQQRIELK